jgi:translation initiation factor 2B subunit (eIF-2B alpha/beta/delta family)
VHPIERLRYVARADGAGPSVLGREAAGALASFAEDPVALVTACRRLVERHPTAGTVWWLAARVLTASAADAWRAAEELEDDPTSSVLAASLPDDAAVLVIGWPELVSDALRRRGDLEVLVAESAADQSGTAFARRLRNAGVDAIEIPDAGIGAAAADVDIVLLEATAMGPDGFVAAAGSRAAAAVAQHAGVPVWVVAGVGRMLPGPLWEALAHRMDDGEDDPWDAADEVVPLDLADEVKGPHERTACPVAPELLKPITG